MNSTKCGGRMPAWVANRMRGCLPPRSGGGVPAMMALSQVLSCPVEIRCSQPASACSIAAPAAPRAGRSGRDVHPGAQRTWYSCRSISRSR